MQPRPHTSDSEPSPDPPRETGLRLASLERTDGTQLRVSLDEFNGYEYICLRVWGPGLDGKMWPRRGKGLGIRLREGRRVAEALLLALQLSGYETPEPAPGQRPQPRRHSTSGVRDEG